MRTPDHEVAVVGGGFSGIGAAIALQKAGIDDVVVIEEGDGVGGAWHWNTYPGVGVDIPSFSYQFSYEQRSSWSRVYAPGGELKAYAESCVDEYGIRDQLILGTRIEAATFSDEDHLWELATAAGGTITARHVIGATGVLTQPKPPAIAGLEDFAGTTVHTARWDHALDLRGKRVAVVGTGASAVQLIPTIAPDVAHLTVFQRTPIWCLPKPDAPLPGLARRVLGLVPGAKWATRALAQTYVEVTFPLAAHYAGIVPLAAGGEKLGLRHLRRQVRDPEVREKLTPRYSLGCKRPSFSNEYLKAFNRENVALEVSPIERVTAAGVLTADGVEHPVDVLVLATGFKVFEPGNMPPFQVTGSDGIDLDAFWAENRFQAYHGLSVPGFPNLFTILGPYGYNGASYFTLIENQMRHVTRLLTTARGRGATRVEVTEEANARYYEQQLGRRENQVFFRGSCDASNSYYFDANGDVPFRPASTLEAAWRSGHFPLEDYRFTAPVPVPA